MKNLIMPVSLVGSLPDSFSASRDGGGTTRSAYPEALR